MRKHLGSVLVIGLGIVVGAFWTPSVAAQDVVRLYGTLTGTPATPQAITVNSSGAILIDCPTCGGGGGGAPTDATYILQTADGDLDNAQAIGALSTGFLFGTTTTGVISSVGSTGSGTVVLATSPTLVTPVIGAATGTSVALSGSLTTGAGAIDVGSLSTGITFSADTVLVRDALADTLAMRRGTNNNQLRIYGTFTNTTNYERMALVTTTNDSVAVAAQTSGTGADNLNVRLIPTGTGQVWAGSTGTGAFRGAYRSSDNSAGVTVTTCTSFKDGICVAGT
jgi:hypothetical protein